MSSRLRTRKAFNHFCDLFFFLLSKKCSLLDECEIPERPITNCSLKELLIVWRGLQSFGLIKQLSVCGSPKNTEIKSLEIARNWLTNYARGDKFNDELIWRHQELIFHTSERALERSQNTRHPTLEGCLSGAQTCRCSPETLKLSCEKFEHRWWMSNCNPSCRKRLMKSVSTTSVLWWVCKLNPNFEVGTHDAPRCDESEAHVQHLFFEHKFNCETWNRFMNGKKGKNRRSVANDIK